MSEGSTSTQEYLLEQLQQEMELLPSEGELEDIPQPEARPEEGDSSPGPPHPPPPQHQRGRRKYRRGYNRRGVGLHMAVEALHMAVGVEALHIMDQGEGMEEDHHGVGVLGKKVLRVAGALITTAFRKLQG